MNIICFLVCSSRPRIFAYMEMSPLPVKDCKMLAYVQHPWPLRREGSLSCHTCCDTGLWFLWSLLKDRSNVLPFTTSKEKTYRYSYPDTHMIHNMFLNRYGCFIQINCHTPTKRKLKLNGEIAMTILRILQKPCEKFNQTWLNASIGDMDGSL